MDVPSARDLGISARHRRDIMRERQFRFLRSLARRCADDASSVGPLVVDDVVLVVNADGDAGDDRLRASFTRSMSRYEREAVEYVTRRARGESSRDVIRSRYERTSSR